MDEPCTAQSTPRLPGGRLAISVVSAVGRGATLLSAFDDALGHCGASNYNIIPLSSVIPPASEVDRVERYAAPAEEFGHRLYVVKADARCDEPGRAIAAGIGWYQWGDGRGLFVEHEAIGTSRAMVKAEVEGQIGRSLRGLCAFRRIPFDPRTARCALSSAAVTDLPSSVLVLAVYRSEGWA